MDATNSENESIGLYEKLFTMRWVFFTFFLLYLVLWVLLNLLIKHDSRLFDYFTDSYGIIAGIGGFLGVFAAKKWGGLGSLIGRSLSLFSIGLLFQFLGQISYAIYFYVFKIDNPYPSFGEIFYFGSIPIYIFAAWLLGSAVGIKHALKSGYNRLYAILIPLLMIGTSYYYFLKDYNFSQNSRIVTFLDFGYPLGEATFMSIAILSYILSRNTLGGKLRNKVILVLFALFIQYSADTVFLVNTINNKWRAGGLDDLIFLVSYFLMGYSLLKFGKAAEEFNEEQTNAIS